jgi:uncharacterized alkaline shock family protein YloU
MRKLQRVCNGSAPELRQRSTAQPQGLAGASKVIGVAAEPEPQSTDPLSSPLGRITISSDAIAQIAARTVARCYGVVGMSARGRVPRLLPRARERQGIEVSRGGDGDGDGIAIDLHVVVEHGLNLAEVAATIRSQVGYEVERLTGLGVASVDVHIDGVRRSA